jgi:hypothetical protein
MPDPAEVEAEQHHARQAALAVLAQQAARKAWARLDAANLAGWGVLARPVLSAVTAAQYAAALDAGRYVAASLAAQGARAPAVAELVPAAFAGVASDGRSLVDLLDQPRIGVLIRIGEGQGVAQAMASGLAQLETIAVTQVQDAGRGGAGVAIAARPAVRGYVRHLRPPSCSRCAVLAGQFYRWNAGFLRHPRCDCRHVPVVGDGGPRAMSPREYFDSLSTADQNRIFTNAGAQAIRDGADLTAVVNARRGMYEAGGRKFTRESTTKRGVMRGSKSPRPMPETIYAQAGGDRDAAIRMLQESGYLRAPVPAPRPAPGGGGLGGGGGSVPLAPPGEPLRRVLPSGTVSPRLPARGEVTGSVPATRASFTEVVEQGRVAPDWHTFTPAERHAAEWLRDRGVHVEAVHKDQAKSPDGIIRAAEVTVEIKTITSARKLEQRLYEAKQQAAHVVIDVRGADLDEDQASTLLAKALRRHGAGLEEVVLVGRGFVLSWP